MSDENNTLELADVIKALRNELTAAKIAGEGEEIRFTVNGVEIELETIVTKEKNATLGMKFWVVDANAGGKYQDAFKQKIKLSLEAKTVTKNSDGSTTTDDTLINDPA